MTKRVLITGATGKIGQAIAKSMAGDHGQFVLHYLHSDDIADSLRGFLEGSGCKVNVLRADLKDALACGRLVDEANDIMGGIDAFIHCAAIFGKTPIGEVSDQEWNDVIQANLGSAFFTGRRAADIMRDLSGGNIVFMSDVAAHLPYKAYLPYSVSKAGIECLVKGFAKAYAPKVLVNAVAPYIVNVPDNTTQSGNECSLDNTLLKRLASVGEVVDVIKLLCNRDSAITGQIIAIDSGRMLK
jgi:NAD(P)-dependent dehydrogenase (short-subunit alcohol dehydrogenase family)